MTGIGDKQENRITMEPTLLYKATVKCPACGNNTLDLEERLYEIPYFGKTILTKGKCRTCGYKYTDARIAEATEPKKIIVNIEGEKELHYLLIKSAYATIHIRETGYKIIPGPASTGYITTIEGILHRIKQAIQTLCKNKNTKECTKNLKWIEEAIQGKRKFTLIICDPEGTSKIKGEKTKETKIDQECNQTQN